MNNIFKYIIGVFIFLIFTLGSVEAKTTYQDFPSVKLRHGYHYNFSDIFNAGKSKVGLISYKAKFTEGGDYNGGPDPKFDWTYQIKKSKFIIDAGRSMRVYQATSNYNINRYPVTRKKDNLFIQYITEYVYEQNGKWAGPITHIENQPYEITWCGDGVRDDYTDYATGDHIYETCDPADSTHSGWGTGGCSNSCEPVISQPVCNSLSYLTTQNPIKIGVDNTTKTVSCTATNATKITIDCGNGVTQDFTGNNSGSKTVSRSCTYYTAGTYTPICKVNDTITNLSCQKSLTVTSSNLTPAIEIIKSDFNTSDKDTVIGNDTQTVLKGDKAVFKIIVKNIGGEDLKDVIITDPVEPSCDRTSAQTKAIYTGTVFVVGDSFEYVCEKTNTLANYTNTANVTGIGVTSNVGVNDTDPTQVIVSDPVFDLALRKTVTSTGTFNVGDIIEYNIEVINQGDLTATGVVVTDYIPANMELVSGNGWSIMGTDRKVINTINSISPLTTENLTIKLKVLSGATGTITNWAEISADNGDDCDSTPDNDQTNDVFKTDNSVGNGCSDTNGDEDDHDPASITIGDVPGEFDLALRKTVTTAGPYNVGDVVEYNIDVINQGTTAGTNIEVTDYIPVNMELVAGNGWSVMGADRKVTNTIASVPVGTTQNLTIRLRILAGATGTITNWSEISADNGNDCDSTPDNVQTNDTFTTDDSVGTVCNDTNGDEDDHDPASIIIGALVCNATTTGTQASPISATTAGLCANAGETVVNFTSTTSGNTTSYTWNCTDGTTTYTGGNCSASYTSGGGGNGGSTYRCNDMMVTGTQVKCIGSSRVKSFGLLCSNQTIQDLTNIKSATHNNTTNLQEATFTNSCDTVAGTTPICYVVDQNTNSYNNLAWRTSNACKDIPQQCGNGKLESGEECERAVLDDGTLGDFPNFCSSSCQITSFGTIPTSDGNLTTEPNQGEIGFVGMYDMVLGHNGNLGKLNNEIYIWNNSDYVFGNSVFNGICLTTNNVAGQVNTGDSLSNVGLTRNCTDITTKFYPGQKIYLKNDLSDIVADKNKVDGADYEDNNLVVTIRTTKDTNPYSKILNWSDHLTGKFKVRVAKPAVKTTGGISYNKAGANTKSIAEDDNINLENKKTGINNNDVSVGVKSSDAQTNNNEEVVGDTSDYKNNSAVINNVTNTDFENYNGLNNVFIKSGNTNISDIDLSSITESTTYIIENGYLIIDDNISVNNNIAFVVKNGDIIINNDIESIKGTYIVLDNTKKIKSDGIETKNILTVNGSLYGDISDLVENRTKVEENDGELTFGTVVSFGSSIFQKPAPMVTSFINDYLSSDKVAK